MKLKATLSSDTKIHHWGVGYGGTAGMGNGPENPYTNATGSWRSSNSTELRAEENSTFNNRYTLLLTPQILLLICQEEIFLGDTIQIIVGTYLMRTLMR